jgi:Histidine phosphatase superfamily (branch 1)
MTIPAILTRTSSRLRVHQAKSIDRSTLVDELPAARAGSAAAGWCSPAGILHDATFEQDTVTSPDGRIQPAAGAVTRLAAAHPGQRLAVFTHGGVIGQMLALASGSRPFAFIGADNGSLSHLVVHGDEWIIRGFNDTAHLGPSWH